MITIGQEWPVQDPAIAHLVAKSVGTSSPAWDRLDQIAQQRKAEHPR
jgi:hypothetical protein